MLARMQVRFLAHRVGDTFSGRVTGVNAFGFFVALDEVFAEGLVRLVDLPNDYYRYDEVRMRLTGRKTGSSFALGDQVRVTVAHVDIRRRHVNLVLPEEESEPEAVSSEQEAEKAGRERTKTWGAKAKRGREKAKSRGERGKERITPVGRTSPAAQAKRRARRPAPAAFSTGWKACATKRGDPAGRPYGAG